MSGEVNVLNHDYHDFVMDYDESEGKVIRWSEVKNQRI